ncbi:response regulator transcription factor [Candidatus Woesearchaeota archaeon]|nr:response regulator transcription factor [Candidatus Woesearchaeota archaeon]
MGKKGRERRSEPLFASSLANDADFQEAKKLYLCLKQKHRLPSSVLFQQLEEQDILIPVTIFNRDLSGLEAICKYLRENCRLSNKEIAKRLNRSEKTTWQAYQSSREKFPAPYNIPPTQYTIPISDIQSRQLSVLETIVKHLKETFKLSYHTIATLLMRDDRTIWTVYHRAQQKHG